MDAITDRRLGGCKRWVLDAVVRWGNDWHRADVSLEELSLFELDPSAVIAH